MTKAGKFALLFAVSFAALALSNTVYATSRNAVAAGEWHVRQLLLLMDQDQNGQVSRAEFMRFMEAEFNRLDVDHNGELSPEELSRSRIQVGSEGQVLNLLRMMDKDKSGQVSRAEFMRFMEAEFNRLDVDHNGELTPSELSRSILSFPR